jgi:tRNA1Val (adenine37-N6)-methyltransferase
MTDYYQPDFYRFNEDSLSLVYFILKQSLKPSSLLDIGSGSGVIGIELARLLKPRELGLLELQKDFIPFLEKNRDLFLTDETRVEIVCNSLGAWDSSRAFDLIVCNPPYYLPGHGQQSDDQRRNLCRNFKQDGWQVLITKISQWLAPSGRAFIVIKNDPVLIKYCERFLEGSGLNKRLHVEKQLCFLELYPRDCI